jgi:hypothetical protein
MIMSYVAGSQHHQVPEHRARSIHGSVFYSIAEFFYLIHKAKLVAGDYEKLSHLSDRELNNIGLTRTGISSHVFAKHFG